MSKPFGANNFFGERLRDMRVSRNLSQAAVAEAVGTGATTVNNWEKGVSTPHIGMLMNLCRFMGVTPNDFLSEDSNRLNIASEPPAVYGAVYREKPVAHREQPLDMTALMAELVKEVRLLREQLNQKPTP